MHGCILISSLLFLALLRNFSTAGAIRERREEGGDSSSAANAPELSVIHFPESEDNVSPTDPFRSSTRRFLQSKRRREDSTASRPPVSPARAAVTATPEPRPLLDEDKLLQFDANAQKNMRPQFTQAPPNVKPADLPTTPAAPQGAAGDFNLSQLSEILKELLNTPEDQSPITTVPPTRRPVTIASVPKPTPAATADAGNEFDKFLPHLEEALMTALQKEASEEQPTPTTARQPPPSPMPPSPDSGEEVFKEILPALQEQIAIILEKSKDEETTAATFPTQRPAQSVTGDDGQQFSEFLPVLVEALKDTIAKGEQAEQETPHQHGNQPTRPTGSKEPSTTSPTTLTTNTSVNFEDFLPELERMFGDILQNAESNHNNELGEKPKQQPSATQKPLSTLTGVRTSTVDPLEGSQQLFQSLESSLADILNDETIQAPAPLQKPPKVQANQISPQPKIVYEVDKYYPQLKKVLEEIVREQEVAAARPSPPKPFDGAADKAILQALHKTVQTIFRGNKEGSVASPNTETLAAPT